MLPFALTDTELAVQKSFRSGEILDVRAFDDPGVRAEVVRFLLLGGDDGGGDGGGELPALRLNGAHITGTLHLAYADVAAPISLRDCRFDEPLALYGARLRQFSLRHVELAGMTASSTTFAANLRLMSCRITGPMQLSGSDITGALILDGTELNGSLDGTRMRVGADLIAHDGFRGMGEIRLVNAEIGGSLRFEGARLSNPGGNALYAPDLRVGAVANFCEGFTADGSIRLHHAQVTSRLCFERAVLIGGKLGLRHLSTRELTLLPERSELEAVDLRHARLGLLRDDPASWPPQLLLENLTYEALGEAGDFRQRLGWLRRDPRGYRPQAYGQLAATYRTGGRDDDAREVLLAGERHQRERAAPAGRVWGWLQDATVGYGYRPARAVAWLAVLMLIGTVVFQLEPPRAAEAAKAPAFVAAAYTADLILPVVDLGQQSNYHARGATAWLGYFLILSGLLFATTIAAAAARRLRRS